MTVPAPQQQQPAAPEPQDQDREPQHQHAPPEEQQHQPEPQDQDRSRSTSSASSTSRSRSQEDEQQHQPAPHHYGAKWSGTTSGARGNRCAPYAGAKARIGTAGSDHEHLTSKTHKNKVAWAEAGAEAERRRAERGVI